MTAITRSARSEDVPALVALEAACWPPALRSSAARIARRIAHDPENQLVVTIDGPIVAAVYTQRIARTEDLEDLTAERFDSLHDPRGTVAQLLAVCVRPDYGEQGIGEALLQQALRRMGDDSTIERIVGVTLCRDFAESGAEAIDAYVSACDTFGLPIDPILRFHVGRGARIVKALPGIHPGYTAGGEAGVLIEYAKGAQTPAMADAPLADPAAVFAAVETAIRTMLGPERGSRFDPDASLNAMGLDSLGLHGLSALLNRVIGTHIDATFFFRHPTARKIVTALTQPIAEAETEPTPPAGRVDESTTRPAAPASGEPVAIIGMACRLPGGATTPELFWRLLDEGRDAIGEPPADRSNCKALRRGGFLDGVDRFDAEFFGISPREASAMDPQQRLMLEVSWEALERAGVNPAALEGSDTSVTIGVFGHDYERLAPPDGHYGTGNAGSVVSGRIAYTLGLRGPALSIDTACSAGLVAVHVAAQSVRSGECRLAIAGAVNLILSPEFDTAFTHAGMLAPDGHCKAFSARADGYVRSEGCAAVVLKRFDDALTDGDRVLAVIEGSAINHDGRSNGLTAPSGDAQAAVIGKALASARLSPDAVGYVEAHGTGTPLGDPIEIAALAEAYGKDRGTPLIVGSVKSNIGHTEAAAGLAGLIKAVLVLEHGRVPRQLHLADVNPLIDQGAIQLPKAPIEWPRRDGTRRHAGVSSFGFSGTNAHVVIAEAPLHGARDDDDNPHLLVLSARSAAALGRLAGDFNQHLLGTTDPARNIARTSLLGRRAERHRLAIVGKTAAEWAHELGRWRTGNGLSAAMAGDRREAPSIAFLFTGQGSQYAGMAAELYRSHAGVRATLDECAALFAPFLERPLLDVMKSGSPDARLLQRMSYAQPALFAVEIALARMWMEAGVHPTAVMGHSLGEIAAACIAGVLEIEDAVRLVAHRGRLMESTPAGAMAVVFAGASVVAPRLRPDGPTIAGYNGPQNTVISGTVEAVERTLADFESSGFEVHRLDVSRASHSRLMESMLEPFAEVCRTIEARAPAIPIVSNVTGNFVAAEITDPDHWVRHVRNPVRFVDGVAALAERDIDVFLEIGPKPVLIGLAQECLTNGRARSFLPSLLPMEADRQTVLQAAGRLFVDGAAIDWRRLGAPHRGRSVLLPTTPFDRKRYWLAASNASITVAASPKLHGTRLDLAMATTVFATRLSATHRPEFLGHRIDGRAVLPAAAAIEMMAGAFAEMSGAASIRLTDVAFHRPLVLPENDAVDAQVILDTSAIRLSARTADGRWTTHAEAKAVVLEHGSPVEPRLDAAFDAALAAIPSGPIHMPIAVERIDLHTSRSDSQSLRCRAEVREETPDARTVILDVTAEDETGARVAAVQGLTFRESGRGFLYHWQWIDLPGEAPAQEAPAGLASALEQRAHALARTALDSVDPRDVVPGQRQLFDYLSRVVTAVPDPVEHLPMVARELDLLERCGAALGDVLRGQREPLDLLLPDSRLETLEQLYSESPTFAASQRSLADAVARIAPQGRPLRILEIGAGTGATAAAVLARLKGKVVEYVYTDVSPLFVARAREKFAGMPVAFQLLDIESDPLAQGFSAGSFDVVIAANVLHATRDLAVSLRNAAAPLKPGGALVLLEGVQRRLWIDLIFGLLPGWWRFADGDLRPDHPLIDGSCWTKRLAESGFAVGPVVTDDDAPFPQAVIVAHRVDRPWLLLGGDPADELARGLKVRGQPCVVMRQLQAADTEHSTIVDLRFLLPTPIAESGPRLLSMLQQVTAASLKLVMADATARPDAAVLKGLAQVASRERPGFSVTTIDCDATPSVEALVDTLLAGGHEGAIRLRQDRRLVARLRPYPAEVGVVPAFRGTHLITGGLGAIGRLVGEWLLKRGAPCLALVGRSPATVAQEAWMDDLRRRGAKVVYRQADVGDRTQCAAILARVAAELPPITGIWHTAGTHDDSLLESQSWARIDAVLAGKLSGALNLHDLSAGLELDHFVLFSSVFGLMGAPGLAGYVAANAGLDALAHARRAASLPALSIDWGPWAATGMVRAGDKATLPEWTRHGLRPMPADRCLVALEAALAGDTAQVAVIDTDWTRFASAFAGAAPNAIGDLVPIETAAAPVVATRKPAAPAGDTASRLRTLPARRQRAALGDHLATLVALALGHDGAERVDRRQGFFAQGLDSLATLELRNRIQATLGWQLEQRLLFRYNSVDSLAAFLAEKYLVAEAAE